MSQERVLPESSTSPRLRRHARLRPTDSIDQHIPGTLASRQTSMTNDGRGIGFGPHPIEEPGGHDLLPFTTEWYVREKAIDARLRKTMRICVNCY